MATSTTGTALTLEVATPKGLALSAQAASVQAPSIQGEFGVLPGHIPLLAALRPGVLKYVSGGKAHIAAVGTGFVEAGPERVLVITAKFEAPEAIDVDAAKRDLAEAEKALKAFPDVNEGADFEILREKVEWANARIVAATLPH